MDSECPALRAPYAWGVPLRSGGAARWEATGMDSAHTLVVLRHAKAAGEPGVNDLQRPLNGRGRRNSDAAGQWLLAHGIVPDLVLCSTSRRTRETWQRVSKALGAAAPQAETVNFEARVYDADAQDLLDLVNEQPDDARTILTVGHNPASLQLVASLTGRSDIALPTAALSCPRRGRHAPPPRRGTPRAGRARYPGTAR